MADSLGSREHRLRNVARRRGYEITKSRTRDPLARDYAHWTIRSEDGVTRISGLDIDQVETWLDEHHQRSFLHPEQQ